MAPTLVEHVVADAGAFIKRAPLQDIGTRIYTLRDVVNEIRDKPTRKSLSFLPYQLVYKEPRPDLVRLVTEFSKKTGDYSSLSATDIKVLALTYQLELEHVGSEHLKTEPDRKVDVYTTLRHPETPVHVAGFHFPSRARDRTHVDQDQDQDQDQTSSTEQFNSFQFWRDPLPPIEGDLLDLLDPVQVSETQTETQTHEEFNSFQFWREPLTSIEDLLDQLEVDDQSADKENQPEDLEVQGVQEDQEDQDQDQDQEDQDQDQEDGGGWITPSNIQQVKMNSADWTTPANVKVGCLTTDFAMQNVLIQIGLHVLSVNGMLIREARNYILRCHACFRTTSTMEKRFCPHCGNQTLKKVAVSVGHDGSTTMHFSRNQKVLNPRGLRHSLPLPQGGKHSRNPQLVEDQPFPQQRLSRKARQKTDVFDPDYVSGSSPFSTNDVHSRAAGLQLRDGGSGGGRRRSNPNASHRKKTNKRR